MHTPIIKRTINKTEYHAMIEHANTPFERTIVNNFSFYKTTHLSELGIREIRLENHTRSNFPDCYEMKVVLNFNVFTGGNRFESYDCKNFTADNIPFLLDGCLEFLIPAYKRGSPWHYEKIEYSKDLYTNAHSILNNILNKTNYVDARKKLNFRTYKSGIEFYSFEANGRTTFRLHIYRKLLEQLDKKYNLASDEYLMIENLYHIEAQIFSTRISALSSQMGISNGSIEDFSLPFIEDNIIKGYIVSIYGEQPYRKRQDVISIINASDSLTAYKKKQLIHILDQINQSSLLSARNKYKGNERLFDSCIRIIRELGINLIYIPYNSTVDYFPSLTEIIFNQGGFYL